MGLQSKMQSIPVGEAETAENVVAIENRGQMLNTAGLQEAGSGEEGEDNSDDDDDKPRCLFNSCFACEDGHCTALNDTDFGGRPCPFFKTCGRAERDRQDAFDRLLITGRLDIINFYEDVLVNLGIEDPGDAGEGPLVMDDDVLAARAEMEDFRRELEKQAVDNNGEDEFDESRYETGKEGEEEEDNTGGDYFS